PRELDVTARPVGIVQSSKTWLSANLVWPPHSQLRDGGPDVAVLRLGSITPQMEATTLPLFDPEAEEAGDYDYQMEVYAVGLQKFSLKDGLRDTHQISGVTKRFSGLISQTFEIEEIDFGKTRDGKEATSVFDWIGFSGAALLTNNRRIVGIVVTAVDKGR